MPRPSYMIDCLDCGDQLWHLRSLSDSIIRVECGRCELLAAFTLTDTESGGECAICQADTWRILEHTVDEHIILSCTECEERAEIWLRGDELDAGD